MAPTPGNLFILAAPSGAGKSSLIRALLDDAGHDPAFPMQVSVSHTTRAPRPNEEDGKHYHFVSRDEFERLIAEGAFFEWAEVFGNYYGTSRPVIEQTLKSGVDVFLDIDWQGARQVKELLPDTCTVFIAPPCKDELHRRLVGRGQDSEEVIAGRMAKAVAEISHYQEFDYVVVNDDFDKALAQIKAIVQSQRLRTAVQAVRYGAMFSELLQEQ